MPDDDALRVWAAVPVGYRPAASTGAWMRAVQAHPAVEALRADARESVLAVAWALTGYADRRTGVCRPTWAVLQAACGRSRSTMAAQLAFLRRHQLLGHVEQGSTPQFRHGDDDGAGNRAAVYVLLTLKPDDQPEQRAPGVSGMDETRTPSNPSGEQHPTARARETRPDEPVEPDCEAAEPRAALRAAGHKDPEKAGRWPANQPATTAKQRLAAAAELARQAPPCRRVSGRHLRHLIRPYLQVEWTVRDLLYALDHTPDGEAHRYAYRTDELYHPAGWIAWRLRHWLGQDGTVMPGHHPPGTARPTAGPVGPEPGAGEVVGESPTDPVDPAELAAAKAALAARLAAATERRQARQADRARDARRAAAAHHQAAIAALPDAPHEPATPPADVRAARVRATALTRARAERAARRRAGQPARPADDATAGDPDAAGSAAGGGLGGR